VLILIENPSQNYICQIYNENTSDSFYCLKYCATLLW